MAKRILFISVMNGAAWGGSEIQWMQAALYGKQQGYDVSCMVYHWPQKINNLKPLIDAEVKIINIPNYGRAKLNILQRLIHEWFVKPIQNNFIKNFNYADYDYVYVNQGGFSEVTGIAWATVYTKCKYYALAFHNYEKAFVFSPEKKTILQNWINNAAQVFFASTQIKNVVSEQINLHIKNYTIIKNPITIEQSTAVTPFAPLQNNNYVMVMIAYLDVRRKAQDNLIKAFACFGKDKNCILEIYGSGEDEEMLQLLINQYNLQQQVFLKGHTSDVKTVLQQAHLVLQLTHIDAMPITVVEAMSMSRPVAITPVGDMPLWIQDEQSGFIAKDSSVNEIQQVLERAWHKKENWQQLGKNAFDNFCKLYPTDVNAYFYNSFLGAK
jgi:glycosyltransferase involved in cell wall biosynthesis